MLQKFLSKYGLATHLAILAAVPLALAPIVTAATLGSVVLWLSAIAAVWLIIEPSMRLGEHLSAARARVRHDILLDPLFWFMGFVVAFTAVRWMNSGIAMQYNAEQSVWAVSDPSWVVLPASVGDDGFLPFTIALASTVLLCGLRHGIGLMARAQFGVVGSLVAGLGGATVAGFACAYPNGFSDWLSSGFSGEPFWPSLFGVWLVIGIASGIMAESRRWRLARLAFVLQIGGNGAALIFFASPLVAVGWLVFAFLALIYCLFYLGRADSSGAVARSFSLAVVGFALPILLLMMYVPETVREAKLDALAPSVAFGESYQAVRDVLSRYARQMWMSHPWSGVGLGAYGLQAQFLAERADWAVIPPHPVAATNGYWTLLAERGIMGGSVLAVLLGMLLYSWGARLVGARIAHRSQDDADIFPFAMPPIAWMGPFCIALLGVEAYYSPLFSVELLLFAIVVPLALSAASFPKAKKSEPEAELPTML